MKKLEHPVPTDFIVEPGGTIGIIGGGKLLAEGTLDELRDRAGTEGMTLEDTFIRLTSGA